MVIDLPGSAYDPEEFKAGCLRADLATLIGHFSLQHAGKIAAAILADYIVIPRRQMGKKKEET